MPGIARYNDIVTGTCSGHSPSPPISVTGFILTVSAGVRANSLGVGRNTDIVIFNCGHTGIIVTSSGTVKSDGLGVARVGDTVSGATVTGTIVVGSSDVNAA